MPRSHVFHEIFLHVNWHCHDDQGLITPDREALVHGYIEEYCRKFRGVFFQGIGGTATHIHLAFQMEPFVAPADFIGKAKGYSSHQANKQLGGDALKWQRGYGIVSLAALNLPAVLRYVRDQKLHHQRLTTREKMEQYYVDLPEGVFVPEADE